MRQAVGYAGLNRGTLTAEHRSTPLKVATMSSAPAKRRKLGHSQDGAEVALESAASAGISRSRAFVLEAEELLDSVRLDYEIALDGVDALLHRTKGAVEAIKAHDPRPVYELRQLPREVFAC